MARIFVSYRRVDSQDITAHLVDALINYFGDETIFRDIYDIDPGRDFAEALRQGLEQSLLVLPLIGPRYIRELQRRLPAHESGQTDWVHEEIDYALKHDKLMIPLLVHGAEMPPPEAFPQELQALAKLPALPLTEENFAADFEHLLQTILGEIRARPLFQSLLQESFNFTADDMAQNRLGKRSQRQEAIRWGLDAGEMGSMYVIDIILYTIGFIFLALVGLITYLAWDLGVSLFLALCLNLCLSVPIVTLLFYLFYAETILKVGVIEGPLSLGEQPYVLMMGEKTLGLSPGQNPSKIFPFLQGKQFRVYIDGEDEGPIFSLEPLDQEEAP
jgi:hypothetical protein